MARLVWAWGIAGVLLVAAGPVGAVAGRPEESDRPVRAILRGEVVGQAVRVLAGGEGAVLRRAQGATDSPEKREADRLSDQGIQQFQVSKFHEALQSWEAALQLYRALKDRQGEANSLGNLGNAYNSLGQYAKAIDFLQQHLAIARAIGDRQGEAASLNGLGLAYRSLGQYQKAIDLHLQSLAVEREIGDHQGEAKSLGSLGIAYNSLGQYQKAIDFHLQSLAIAREIGDRQGEANSLGNLGVAYNSLGQYQKAIDFLQQSLAIAREISDRSAKASILGNLGNAYYSLGQYQKAIDFHLQSLAVEREIGDRQREANSLGSLGVAYDSLGQYQKAIDFNQQSLAIAREIGNRQGEAISLLNLGNAYYSLGQYQKAIDFLSESWAISRAIGDRQGEAAALGNLGNALGNLGNAYYSLGQYQEAIKFHYDSLAIAREIGDRQGEAAALGNLGNAYYFLEQYQEAIHFLQQQLAIDREIGNREGEAISLNNPGNAYKSLGQYQKAIDFHLQSLAIAREIGDRQQEANSLGNLGNAYNSVGQYLKGNEFLQQSLAIAREIGDRQGEANSLGSLGNFYNLLWEYQKALNFHQQSLAIARAIGDRAVERIALSNLGVTFVNQKQPDTAIAFFKQSVNVTEAIRRDNQSLDAAAQKSYTDTVAGTYRRLADLLFDQGRIAEAQEVLELLKVQEVRDYSRSARTTGEKRNILLSPAEQAVVNTFGSVAELGQQLAACDNQSTSQCTNLRDQLDSLTAEFNAALKNLSALAQQRKNDPNFLDPNALSGAKALQIVNTQPNTMLVYLLVLEDKLRILYVGPGGVVGQRTVAVSQADLGRNIGTLRDLLESPSSNLNDLKTVSNRLYTWLIAPLESELKAANTQHLIFALDRVTRYLPLAVLWDGQQYLLQRYTSATILSADLTNTTAKMPAASQPNTILALGFSDAAPGFNPLTNVPAELDAIVRETSRPDPTGLYNGDSLLNREFTRTALRDRTNGRSLLHIATHAQFLPNDDPFLLLGNGDKFPVKDLETWNRYFADTHLVVLSACQTGFGGPNAEGIEIPGIYSYFLNNQAADTVLASLWKVDDRATTLLMQDFYRRLATTPALTKAEALRQTQLDFLAGKIATPQDLDNRNPAHPYHWAPFVLTGNSW